ncbi:eukaryotic translation initiation factor 3 subunit B [Tilletiaria anomala UBC 951]|uniref:Eukaryotic translation initiation factor 3 subunit B n=1 Tax=Tilletiaria anomala (strain ATCC 24038 / CBS 436.72 / UBC 951) TaxID=1037660 RepID=A0A066W551_TILAU|nr:eukaryotic translation initiation factor 3 subunit B [Tilletiaria anomala UBC 951]KDN45875.1 eukaryotic translation initiation factor 3 subunit B [Tilletiaria anomala UBC 951]
MNGSAATTSNATLEDQFEDLEIDYSDIEAKYAVDVHETLDDVIVIDGVPSVGKDREAKLLETVAKRFKQYAGLDVNIASMQLPYDDDGKSKGYMFIEMNSAQDATTAIKLMDQYPFDKKHRFFVNRFTDIEKLANLDETYSEPAIEAFKEKEHLRSWLADSRGRDQLVMCQNESVSVHWHQRTGSPQEIQKRERWTESYVSWSPLGTLLATFRIQGVTLWGGPAFSLYQRFAHPGVRLIDFSPNEKYIVTWSPQPIVVPENMPQGPQYFAPQDEGNRVAVWDVGTGHLLRTFPVSPDEGSNAGGSGAKGFTWPFLKWSGDDMYCARIVPGKKISVFQLPTMGLLEKKSIEIEGVVDFEWCPLGDKDKDAIEAYENAVKEAKEGKVAVKKPKDNMLVFWVPEVANQPARVSVMSIPTREILRTKNLFNVSDCKLHWHPQGDYLCVKVDRHTKTKKSMFCNLELFKMREKNLPVEVIELKDPVTAFAWEPQGSHFALISSNDPNLGAAAPGITIKTQINLYYYDTKKGDFRSLKVLDNKTSNTLYWSPKGRHLVVATMGSSQKFDLEWYDVDLGYEQRQGQPANDPAEEVKQIGAGEHYGITDLEWDPSGRYVITSASVWRHTMENGYAIWDWRGNELQKHVLERFKQILWRPRPRTLLSKEQQKAVRRNVREIGKQFEEEDAAEESNAALQHRELYQRKLDEWKAWRQANLAELNERRVDAGLEPVVTVHEQLQQQHVEESQEWIEEVLEETTEEVVE